MEYVDVGLIRRVKRLEAGGAHEIARRSRGTPRIANRLLRRVRDYAQVKGNGIICVSTADRALNMLKVDEQGFDHMDRRLLLAIMEKFEGGPVGVESLAAAIGDVAGAARPSRVGAGRVGGVDRRVVFRAVNQKFAAVDAVVRRRSEACASVDQAGIS